jgi:hypothetical protein
MVISYKYYSHLTKEMRGSINKNRITRFDLLVTAGEAKVAAPLSPILGQFGLSCQEFCNKFNAETEELLSGLPMRLKFTAYPQDREFKYIFLGISFVQVVSSTFTESINFTELYKIYLIYRQFFDYNFKGKSKELKIMRSLLGCLKTLHLFIKTFYN